MNKKNKQSNMPQRQSPIVIKISKSILYIILSISIMSLIVSILTLVITLSNPIKTNKKLDTLSGQMTELVRIWQSGTTNSGNTGNTPIEGTESNTNKEDVEVIPDINDPYIQEQLGLVATELIKIANSDNVKNAMSELDTSSISVKGMVSNINMASVSNAFKEISQLKDNNRYITKTFFGTREENFVSAPELEVPKTYKPTSEQWYKLAQTGKDVQCSQIHQDEFTKEYVVTLSIIVKKNDREVGVLGAQINLSKIK